MSSSILQGGWLNMTSQGRPQSTFSRKFDKKKELYNSGWDLKREIMGISRYDSVWGDPAELRYMENK